MLRLHREARTEDFSRLYHSIHAFDAHSLRRVGKDLAIYVSRVRVRSCQGMKLIAPLHSLLAANCSARTTRQRRPSWTKPRRTAATVSRRAPSYLRPHHSLVPRSPARAADEINALRKEAGEMRALRATLTTPGAAQRVFDKVFKADVDRLLGMDEMWRNRKRPTPLVYDEAKDSTAMPTAAAAAPSAAAAPAASSSKSQSSLRDQRQLPLNETVDLFTRSLSSLATRASSSPTALSFDKDDEDALDFVTSASNLRSIVYSIETKTRFDVKQMAGNIIPAIASTNAIISGALVLQALHLLAGEDKGKGGAFGTGQAHDVMLGKSTRHVLSGTKPPAPNPACSVCADAYVPLLLSGGTTTADVTLGTVIALCRTPRSEGGLGLDEEEELGVYEGNRLLADPDFEDNHERSLASLGVEEGKFLALVDEDGGRQTVQVIVVLRKDGEAGVALPPAERLPVIKAKPKVEKEEEEKEEVEVAKGNGAKVAEDDDDDFEIVDPAAAAAAAAATAAAPTSKKRKSDGDDADGEEEASKKRRGDVSNGNGNGEAEGSKKRRREEDRREDDDDVIVLD